MLNKFMNDEAGFVISSELVLVLTIAVLSMVVGLHLVAKAVTQELNDLASAIGSITQGYSYNSLSSPHASIPGSAFADAQDACDCTVIVQEPPSPKTQAGAVLENGAAIAAP